MTSANHEVFSGRVSQYGWISIKSQYHFVSSLLRSLPDVVIGHVVAITAFDSGPLTPNKKEISLGWVREGPVLWTTRIKTPDCLPWDNYDEWYIFNAPVKLPELAIFVNYGSFSLEDPRPLYDTNPSWDRHPIGPKLELQRRFWEQLIEVNPTSYIACGDCLNFVTRDEDIFNRALKWSEHPFEWSE